MKGYRGAFLALTLFLVPFLSFGELQAPSGLMCDLLEFPELTVIQDVEPEFSWIVNSSERGDLQSAYQILVASSSELIDDNSGDCWDSGKVLSSLSINISYVGFPLEAGKSYYWKVRMWNREGLVSDFSTSQKFTMAAYIEEYATSTYPLQQTTVKPVIIKQKKKGHYFIDFGKAAFGYLVIDALDIDLPVRIKVRLGEKCKSYSVDRKPGGTIRYESSVLRLPKGSGSYRVELDADKRNTSGAAILLPSVLGVILPFRYVEIIGYPGQLTDSMVRQIAIHYPFNSNASFMNSSDATLNAVWDLCKYSLKATSYCGIYVDGDRERIPYEADAYINQLLHYGVDREYSLARYSHEYLLRHPTWPTEWILDSVLMAWTDYLYTGNRESLIKWYDDLQAKTLTSLARKDGLISTQTGLVTPELLKSIHLDCPVRDIVDWPPAEFTMNKKFGERDGYDMVKVNTVINAFHYRAISLMGRIAEALEKTEDADLYLSQAIKVKQSINDKLFDEIRGIYIDGEGSSHASLHANMMPLAFGLVPDEHMERVTDFIESKGMLCSVYGSQFLLDGLYLAGKDHYALELMRAKHDRSWWNMIEIGSTITLEAWDWKYKNNLDWNHAWGAVPGNIIPRHLLGVSPLEPGFARLQVKIQPGSLKSAEGRVPTIRGPVEVGFRNREDRFEIILTIPGNTVAEVFLPATEINAITESGFPVDQVADVNFLRKEGKFMVFEVGGGVYEFTSQQY